MTERSWSRAILAAEDSGDLAPLLAELRAAGLGELADALVRWRAQPWRPPDRDGATLACAAEFRELTALGEFRSAAGDARRDTPSSGRRRQKPVTREEALARHVEDWRRSGHDVDLDEVRRLLDSKGPTYKRARRAKLL